jgi:serine/threonine-protein kinase RsbW
MSAAGIQVSLALRLPRDVAGLKLVRAVTDPMLAAFGVTAACRQDIAVALVEACGNAIRHASYTDEYHVTMTVSDGMCAFEVTDSGVGFLVNAPPIATPADAVSGRGLFVIAQLADRFEVDSQPGRGTTIRVTKGLDFTTDPPDTSLG